MKKVFLILFVIVSFGFLFGCLGGTPKQTQINATGSVQDGLMVPSTPSYADGVAQSVDDDSSVSTCKKELPIILVDINGIITRIDSILPYSINSKLPSTLQLTSDVTVEAVSSYDDGKGSGWVTVVDVTGKAIGSRWIEEGKSLNSGNGKITVESFFKVDC